MDKEGFYLLLGLYMSFLCFDLGGIFSHTENLSLIRIRDFRTFSCCPDYPPR